MVKTLLIDNYDSYTYNLFQILSEVNGGEIVLRCSHTYLLCRGQVHSHEINHMSVFVQNCHWW